MRFLIWGIGPSAILEVCTEFRGEALSVYERLLWFDGPRDQPILCSHRILNPTECVSIYTKKPTPPPLELQLKSGEAVYSVVDWMNISLDFKVMLQSQQVFLEYFENWPPRENDVLCDMHQLRVARQHLRGLGRKFELHYQMGLSIRTSTGLSTVQRLVCMCPNQTGNGVWAADTIIEAFPYKFRHIKDNYLTWYGKTHFSPQKVVLDRHVLFKSCITLVNICIA